MAMSVKEILREFAGEKSLAFGVDTVFKSLRPGAQFILSNLDVVEWKDPEGRPAPTQQEILDELARQEQIAKHYQYVFDRSYEYPPGYEQLDMLWHDIDSGKSLKEGSWYNTIKEIREKYPKSEGPAPE